MALERLYKKEPTDERQAAALEKIAELLEKLLKAIGEKKKFNA